MAKLTDAQLIEQVKKHKKAATKGLSAQRANIKKCRAFEAGDYMEYTDKIQFTTPSGQKKRVTVQINKIKPYKNSVKGFFAQNRRKPNYIAQLESATSQIAMIQNLYSKYTNSLSEYLRSSMNADPVETQQDDDLLTCGLGAVETAMSFGEGFASKNANGEIVMGAVDLDTLWWDDRARATNLLDARYMGITKQYHLDDALELFKGSSEEDFEGDDEGKEGNYEYAPNLGSYDRQKYDYADEAEGMINVDFYHYYAVEKYFRADNPMSSLQNPASQQAAMLELQAIAAEIPQDDEGNSTDPDFDPADDILAFNADTKAALVEAFGDFIQPEEFRRKVFYSAVTSGNTTFSHFRSEHQDGFGIKVKTGDYDKKNKIWIGIINSMMEPQKYYNKTLTELMFVIAANAKGGLIVEEDAVEDIEEFEDQYARTDSVCVVRSGAINSNKFKDKRQPYQPSGLEAIIELADNAIPQSGGFDPTFLGSAENGRETAQLQRQRIRQIVSMLACYVDSVSLYQKEHARLMLDLMRVYAKNNRGALFRILGEGGPDQFIAISEDKLASKYDISIGEAPVTPEEKSDIAEKLIAMGDKLTMGQQMEKASACYAMAARYMSLDHEDMMELVNILTPQAKPVDPAYVAQLEQMVQEFKNGLTQAQIADLMAAAKLKESSTSLNSVKEAETRANIHLKAGQTSKTLEDANKIHIENKFSAAHPKEVFGQQPAAGN